MFYFLEALINTIFLVYRYLFLCVVCVPYYNLNLKLLITPLDLRRLIKSHILTLDKNVDEKLKVRYMTVNE